MIMTKLHGALAACLLAATALAGCMGDDNADAGGAASVSSVALTSTPESTASGEKFTVCWRVEGSGTIPHVAVHYDSKSHPDAGSFADYKGGAAYPDNATQADAAGYALPGTFCTAVPAPESGTVYYRGHAMTEAPGELSEEGSTDVGAGLPSAGVATGVTVTSAPASAAPGEAFTVCWRVDGTGTVPHVAVHFDTESHPASTSFQDYKGGAAYPDNETQAAAAGYALPGDFCTALTMPAEGSLYYRGHVIDSTGAPGRLSSERETSPDGGSGGSGTPTAGVATGVSVTQAPQSAAAGSDALVCWRVEGTGTVPHVALHYDTESHPASTSFQDYKGGASYPGNATKADAEGYALPGDFCANVPMPDSGPLYFRAHVIDAAGPPGKLSSEVRISSG